MRGDEPLGCSLTVLKKDRSVLSCEIEASLFYIGLAETLSEYTVVWYHQLQKRSTDVASYCGPS